MRVVVVLAHMFLGASAANWEVSRICIKNSAPFVLHWEAHDKTTGSVGKDSGNVLEGQTKCQSLTDLDRIESGHPILAKIYVVAGKTRDVEEQVTYNASSPYTASFTCKGVTLSYECKLDGFDHCDASGAGTASADWDLRTLIDGSEYGGRWQNWFENVVTCDTLVFPKNDHELSMYLKFAASKNYKVRVTGATHSASGLVDQKSDDGSNTLVISLGRYHLSDDSWCNDGDFCLDQDAGLARANAGRSWLDLYQVIRPKGWFVPTQTAGYFFSIAGSVLGTVHGGAYGKTFVNGYVQRMRVMLWDGSTRVIEGEEVYKWRSSYGLLGILTAVEIQVVHRDTFEMYTTTSELQPWDEDHFWKFVAEDAEANLDLSFFPGSKSFNMSHNGIYGEYFLDFVTDTEEKGYFRTQGVLWKTPVHPKVNHTEDQMRKEYAKKEDKDGKIRESGGDKIPLVNQFLAASGLEKLTNSPDVANLLIDFNYLGQDTMVDTQSATVNDGYWVGGAPNVNIAAYFVPIENAFEAFDYVRSQQRARHYGGNDACYRFNDPVEYRFVEVTDDALLQIVPPGRYVVSELLGFVDAAPGKDSWQRAFAEVECEWTSRFGGIPHLMKLHSFGDDDGDGVVEPMQRCSACRYFTETQKQKFEAVRAQYDPHGLFATGAAYSVLLQPCPSDCPSRPECPPAGQPDCGSGTEDIIV